MPLYSHVWNAHFPPNNTSNPGCVEGCLWIPTSPHSVDNRSVQESSTSQNCSLLFGEWKRNISTTLSSAKLHWLLIELWYESKFASVSPQWKMFNSANQSIQTAGQMKAEPAWMFGMHCSRTGISIAAHILADANQSCRIRSFCAEKSGTLCNKKKCYWTLVCICLHVPECHQVSSLGGIIGHLQELRNQQICRDPQLEELIQPLGTMHFTCRCWIMNGPTEISDQLKGVADRRRNANSVRYLYPL